MRTRKPRATQRCGVCSTETAKYTCPADEVPYCSVKCFKQHKEATGCSGSTNPIPRPSHPPPPSTSDPIEPPTTHDGTTERPLDRPLKRLRDLRWPVEPDSTIFMDPLRRGEVKPLRGFEYHAIATHPKLRSMLVPSSSPLDPPSLRSVLQNLASLKTYEAKESALRKLLDAPAPPSKDRLADGRGEGGGRGGRGSRGRGRGRGGYGYGSTRDDGVDLRWAEYPAARQAMLKFADEVRKVLTEAREKGA